MKKWMLALTVIWTGVVMAQGSGTVNPPSPGGQTAQSVRPVGVVTQLQPDSLTLRTDAGPELQVPLPAGINILRVPPGSKDLKAATPITVADISVGDRVLVRGRVSDDQKSVEAVSIIVMAKTDLEKAREAERLDWQRRGIGGLVKAVNPETGDLTISVPAVSGNLTRPVTVAVTGGTVLLRYAPDSVKFSDAKPSTFAEIKVGDQIRALGTKSEDGSRFAAEKLVSGTFRNLGATVVSVDAPNGAVTVKDLVTGKPMAVRTNADSRLRRLPPFVAQMMAVSTANGTSSGAAPAPGLKSGGPPSGAMPRTPQSGGRGPEGGFRNGPPDFQQVVDRSPSFALADLKPGEALIVVSTEGAKPAEVTAMVLLAGVEPILAARPKDSNEVMLGSWNLGMGENGQ